MNPFTRRCIPSLITSLIHNSLIRAVAALVSFDMFNKRLWYCIVLYCIHSFIHSFVHSVVEIEDNSIQIRKDMEKFVYDLRIPAQVKVVEMVGAARTNLTYM